MDLEKEERINAEIKRLNTIYTKIPPKKKKILDGLIKRAAYMRVMLEDYEKDILENGAWEFFTQSDKVEPYERERPVARLYNSMNKNYQSIIKQMGDYIKDEQPKEKKDEFMDFVMEKVE